MQELLRQKDLEKERERAFAEKERLREGSSSSIRLFSPPALLLPFLVLASFFFSFSLSLSPFFVFSRSLVLVLLTRLLHTGHSPCHLMIRNDLLFALFSYSPSQSFLEMERLQVEMERRKREEAAHLAELERIAQEELEAEEARRDIFGLTIRDSAGLLSFRFFPCNPYH